MRNNKVFVLCQTNVKRWQMRCANAERHVESRDFAATVEHDFGTMLSAVSPRRVLDGTERDDRERYGKLKRAMRECRYVYLVDGWEGDPMCVRLRNAARWRFKTFLIEEED